MSSPKMADAIRATLQMTDERNARRVADLLTETYDDNDAGVAVFEGPDGRWDITMYFIGPVDEAAIRARVALATDAAAADTVVFGSIAPQDWVKASLEGLSPVRAGRFLIHGSHDRHRVPANSIGIEIEAALAFGTGHHGTTRGCLLLLDQVLHRRRPRRILDLGTGTGVLAIAAARALQRHVLASDIDPLAALTARDNARLNKAGHLVQAICASGLGAPQFATEGPFDLVLANILANPLRRLAMPLRRHLAPGASVILSGLLPDHAKGVVSAYRSAGLVLERRLQLEGWTSLLMTRPA